MIPRICIIVATEMTITAFLRDHVLALCEHYQVTLILRTDREDFATELSLPVRVISLHIERNIDLLADLHSLFRLIAIFHTERFDLVHSVTPKAGLLSMTAGKLIGIPLRLHTFTGQVWATRTGLSRWFLKSIDRLLAASATHLLADSFSQRQFIIEQGVTKAEKINVLADGSIGGVDTIRFRRDGDARSRIRASLDIERSDVVLLFIGRLTKDKGILDLVAAFARLAEDNKTLHLLIVGPDEEGLSDRIRSASILCNKRVHFAGYTDSIEAYYSAADVFCLPSYREGFGNVVIEAAACKVPTVGSRIYGISDAIVDGQTGLLFPARDIAALTGALLQLIDNPEMRVRMGNRAHQRVRDAFPATRVVQAWLDYYRGLL